VFRLGTFRLEASRPGSVPDSSVLGKQGPGGHGRDLWDHFRAFPVSCGVALSVFVGPQPITRLQLPATQVGGPMSPVVDGVTKKIPMQQRDG
jgi:hypothetical protein